MPSRRHALMSLGVLATLPGWAAAQPAPTLEAARILTGFPAGGTVDAVARRMAERLRGTYARNLIVENKPGAGGRLAVDELRRAPPDGSTLLITPAAMITLYPHLYPKLTYGLDDVAPVVGAASVVFGLAVGPGVPEAVRTLKDYLEWARATPAKAAFGSPGAGSPPHYVGALLEKETGVALNHVPYRGTVPGVQDTLGGQIASFIGPVGDYLPHVKTGRLRVLATSGPTRTRFLPDVPTFTELGLKALEQVEWYGFFLPGRTTPDTVARAATALRGALSAPDIADAFAPFGLEVSTMGSAQLTKAVRDEHAAWAPVVKRIGFSPES